MDAGEGHAKRTRQVRERRVARGQLREDRPACGVGERRKCSVECRMVRLNHVVKSRAGPGRVKPPRTSTACAVALISPHGLHDRALDSGARRVPEPTRGPWGHSGGGRAPLSGLTSPPALRPRGARRRARGGRYRVPARARARWPPHGATGLDQHRVAQRQLPRLRGLHGDARVCRCVGAAARARASATHRDPVCGSRALALPPPADRRRIGRSGGPGEPHPRRRTGGSASAVGARPSAPGRAAALSGWPGRADRPVLARRRHPCRPSAGPGGYLPTDRRSWG